MTIEVRCEACGRSFVALYEPASEAERDRLVRDWIDQGCDQARCVLRQGSTVSASSTVSGAADER